MSDKTNIPDGGKWPHETDAAGPQGPTPTLPHHDGTAREGAEFMDVSRVHAAIMREKDEPVDGYEPVPAVWLTAVVGLAMWGGAYLGSYNMAFAANALEGAPMAQLTQGPESKEPVDPMKIGKRVFNNCMACHQATGTGIAGQFPPLAGSEWVKGDEATLVRILLNGLEGPMQVAGKAYNGAMPAWGTKLSDEQIGGVLTYIRGSWDNAAAPIAPEKVAEVRKFVGKRDHAWSSPQLEATRGTP